jgi:hypothetical protein
MNNLLWALAVLVLIVQTQASPIGDIGEVAVEEVKQETDGEVVEDLVVEKESPVDKQAGDQNKENEPVAQDTIKEENKAKCDKCLAPIFRHNHDNFCIKCANAGEIDASEQAQIATALKCKKCRKAKFRSRHGEFCDQQCQPQQISEATEEPVLEEEQQAPEIIDQVVQEVVEDLEDNVPPKKKKKNKKNKNKNKNKKHHKDEIISITNELDDNYNTKFATTMIDNAQEVVTNNEDEENLGIFGSILKHLIVSNTWGTAN